MTHNNLQNIVTSRRVEDIDEGCMVGQEERLRVGRAREDDDEERKTHACRTGFVEGQS